MAEPKPEAETGTGRRERWWSTRWVFAAVVSAVVAVVLIWFVLPGLLPLDGRDSFWDFGEVVGQPLSPNERAAIIEARVDATLALIQLLTMIALAFAAVAGFMNYRHAQRELEITQRSAERQLELARQAQVNERFTRAIEQLGSTRPDGKDAWETRLGGIFALERIAIDFPDEYYGPVMEVLTAYVRGQPRVETPASRDWSARTRQPTGVQAVLDVIGRRTPQLCERLDVHIDLGGTDLRGANLRQANLRNAGLQDAQLDGAFLVEADLRGASVIRSSLNGATLRRASLEGANLSQSSLERADLQFSALDGAILNHAAMTSAVLNEARMNGARLESADLSNAMLDGVKAGGAYFHNATMPNATLTGADLTGAHLEGADLRGAHLEHACLADAHLEDADLRGAHLEGADLRGVHLYNANLESTHLDQTLGLTEAIIRGCRMNQDTTLPSEIAQSRQYGH